MDRRAFISVVRGSILAGPFAAEAQQPASIPRIAFLSPSSLSDPRQSRFLEAFRRGAHDQDVDAIDHRPFRLD
jgi:hypothetical protein